MNAARFAVLAAAVGALSPQAASAHAQITTTVQFDREIVRVLDDHCVACHVDNGPAFALVTYEQTYRARWQIRQDALSRHMAPWAAVPGYGDFQNDNGLTQREVDFVSSWAESFGPRNNGAVYAGYGTGAAPQPVQAHVDFSRWAQGAPDLLLSLPTVAVVPQGPETVYRTVIDPGLRSERWLSGLEYKPSDRRFVHAATFRVQETGQWLASWTPWQGFVQLPPGLAYRLPAGAHIAVQIDYFGATQPLAAHGSLGLYFSHQPSSRPLADQVLDARSTTLLPQDTNILALLPQLHAGVSSIEVSARMPDGATQVLLFARDIPRQWPTPYIFSRPVALSKGTRLSVIEHYAANVAAPADAAAVTLSTFQGAPLAGPLPSAVPAPAIAAQHFKLTGTVKSVDSANRRVVVDQADIPGYMGAMTMSYAVGTAEQLQAVAAGNRIRADVVVNDSGSHLENIEVTGR